MFRKLLNQLGFYTKSDVHSLIKQSISSTSKGVFDYIRSKNVVIVDAETGIEVPNAIISTIKDDKEDLSVYVYARLNANGIEMIKSA